MIKIENSNLSFEVTRSLFETAREIEDREPYPNAVQSANWKAAGLCAHESAMKNGVKVEIPNF